MNCHECQTWICDVLDGKASEPVRVEAERHRATCGACQSFERALRALEPQLRILANRPVLPTDFVSTVALRLPATPRRLGAEEITQRRVDFQREHRAALAALKARFWPWQLARSLLRLACLCVFISATWLVASQAEEALRPHLAAWLQWNGLNGSMILALAVVMVALAWNWKLRAASRRWRGRLMMMSRPLRV